MPVPDTAETQLAFHASPRFQVGASSQEAAWHPLADALASRLVERLGDRFDMLERLMRNLFEDAGRVEKRTRHTTESAVSTTRNQSNVSHLIPPELDVGVSSSQSTIKTSKISVGKESKIFGQAASEEAFDLMDDTVPGERDEYSTIPFRLERERTDSKVSVFRPKGSKGSEGSLALTEESEDMLYSVTEAGEKNQRKQPLAVAPFGSHHATVSLTHRFVGCSAKDSMASLDFDEMLLRLEFCGRRCKPRAVRPESNLRVAFDMLSLAILLYDAITIPFIIAWDPDMSSPFFILFWITPAFWTLDMCLGFFTGYYVNEVVELKLGKTIRHYACTRFPIDLVVNSVDWFFIAAEMETNLAPLRLFKSNRLLRLFSLFRMARIWLRVTQFKQLVVSDSWHMLTSIIKLFFIILYLNHVIACTWFGLGLWRGQSDTGVTWLNAEDELTGEDFVNASIMYQYTTGLHWAMTQMTPGSMEVFPKNSLERVFNIICLLNGLLFGTSLVSQLSAKMIQLQLSKQEQLKNMLLLRRYIRQENISASLGHRVLNDVRRALAIPPRLRSDSVPYLNQISAPLKVELRFELFSPHLLKDPMFFMFDNLDRTVLRDICLVLDVIYLQSGEHLFHHGHAARDAYIVSRGTLEYTYSSARKSIVTNGSIDSGHSSGAVTEKIYEDDWISKVALWANWTTRGSAIAVTPCDLIRVSYTRLSKAVAHHYKIDRVWEEYVKAFSEAIDCLPGVMVNDVNSNVEMGDVVMKMPLQTRLMLAHAVFKYLRKHERGKWIILSVGGHGVGELEQEVRTGKCLLLLNEERTPERIAFLTALNIIRPDGKILVQVASFKRGIFEAACQLPGLKREEGEEPRDAIKRIMTKRLHGLKALATEEAYKAACQEAVNNCERQSKSAISRNFHLNTKYLVNVHTIHIKDMEMVKEDTGWLSSVREIAEVELSDMSRKFRRAAGRRSVSSSTSGVRDWSQGTTRLIRDREGKDGIVYAWLNTEDFEYLCDHTDDVNTWVGAMSLDPGSCST